MIPGIAFKNAPATNAEIPNEFPANPSIILCAMPQTIRPAIIATIRER